MTTQVGAPTVPIYLAGEFVEAGTPLEATIDTPVDGLGVTREEIDNAVVFRLSD